MVQKDFSKPGMLTLYLATFIGFIFQVLFQLLPSHVNFNINEIFFFVQVFFFFSGGKGC